MVVRNVSNETANGDGAEKAGQRIALKGTTLAVFRFMFKSAKPVGPRDIQRGLSLSSASIASYHLGKLLEAGLVIQRENGYIVNKNVFENVIRVKRLLIPAQISYVAFFATTISVLITVMRPSVIYPGYYFSIIGLLAGLALSAFEVKRALSKKI